MTKHRETGGKRPGFSALLRLLGLWTALILGAPGVAYAAAPHWTPAQVERLVQWLDYARDDALTMAVSEVPKIRKMQGEQNEERLDEVATDAAVRLLTGFYTGCCDASLKTGWQIAGDRPTGDPRQRVVEALAQDRLDQMFIDAEPHHPFYRAMRRAYAAEADAARRATLAANMDRWRWMPRALGRRYLLVNTASFEAML
ncbi:hypothetical protein [Sphingobium subterraneum]|uniref:Murein L,D-transpeptidase YcbB/YkuD n=1 Tax=Sphingobium subterraneum TaxID=627688 RepID=A0A841IVX2_9SPHN|nr:hypothetical protein [Sphingobium subterraneum]MBB6122410.1 murein L,D-transpeptidase YcbB/YkuD [Sphingobium subterraneum]